MRTWAKGTARAALLTAGFVALSSTSVFSGAAFADTDGRNSVLGGNQVNLPISAPIDASGNAVGILGTALAQSRGGASVDNGDGSGANQMTSGEGSIGGGNQVNAPISVPVNACGNAVAVLGTAGAGCAGGAHVGGGGHGGYGTSGGQMTSGEGSILGGNQVNAPISVPVNVCGNAVGNAVAACEGGASVEGGSGDGVTQITSGEGSILGGNQINAPISVPVNVCGNAVALLGQAGAVCEGGASVEGSGDGVTQITSGEGSILGGNQVNIPVEVPVNVCGNSVAVLGAATAGCEGQGHHGHHGHHYPPVGNGCSPCDGGFGYEGQGHHGHHYPPVDSGCNPCDGGSGYGGGSGYEGGYDYGTQSDLPLVDQAAGELPVAPGSALPTTAEQLTGAATSELPDELPGQVTEPVGDAAQELPGQVTEPIGDAAQELPGQASQDEQAGRSADLPSPPVDLPAGLPTGGPVLPGTGEQPQTLPAKAEQGAAQLPARAEQGASELPAKAEQSAAQLPVKAEQGASELPVQSNLPVGTDAVTSKAGKATGAVSQVKDQATQATQMAPMSASEPIGAGSGATSMSLLLLGGILAGASAAAAFARRVMVGRR